MGMFPANPAVISDGTNNHSYYFRGQLNDSRSKIGEYIESAATVAAEPLIVVKHDMKSAVPRHLVSSKINKVPTGATDGVFKGITINTTIVADKSFTVDDINLEFTKHRNVLALTDLVKNLLASMVG